MMVCPSCGAEISDTAKFCRKCGTKIEVEDKIVDFDWDQEVEIEEPQSQSEEEAEMTYEWGPPMGSGDNSQEQEMMPVHVTGAETSVERYGEDENYDEYEGDGVIPPWDHTHEFAPEDISDNKVTAMAAYLLGPLGIIIALLAAQNSPYVGFHVRQSLKFLIVEALVTIVMLLLCWTMIVPAAGMIFLVVLLVLRITAFVSICRGRAIEPPILRSLKFLR